MANEYKNLSEADLDKLTNAVFGLLPRGALFNIDESNNLFKFVKYIADNSRGDLTYVSDKLMDELNPDRTDILLDFWIEAAFSFDAGDECITREELRAETKEERRRILIARLLENGRVDRDYIERILNIWIARTDLRVYEFFPSRLDVMSPNDTINESSWVFIDSGGLRIGERFTFETRTIPSWEDDYYIYGVGTKSGKQFGIWTNVPEWETELPILTGDAEWNAGEGSFRLGKDGLLRLPENVGVSIGGTTIGSEGQGTILATNIYSTVQNSERYIYADSGFDGLFQNYIYNQNGFYNVVYRNFIDGSITLPPVTLEEWEGVMMYLKQENADGSAGKPYSSPYSTSVGFYVNGNEIDEKIVDNFGGIIITGERGVGEFGRAGPLYARDLFILVEKPGKNLSYNQWLERRRQVGFEISNPIQKYDNVLSTPFYNSTYTFVDGDLDADDVKTFDLVKCILKRILPLSLDYGTGKTT